MLTDSGMPVIDVGAAAPAPAVSAIRNPPSPARPSQRQDARIRLTPSLQD
ncbi:hypothetical protein A6P39_037765 [Streptomyces sp. FXJ1.172]|nr:hypothetical protein [Streptomyces sp. FXJ1.172]WEO99324.1 hypothetical protein A6P39_037765 [Streptomyces sp. FXJ1.172]